MPGHNIDVILENSTPRSTSNILPTPEGYIMGWGTTVPTDAASGGYCPGAIFIHTDGAAGSMVYVNEGSKTSNDFNRISEAGNIFLNDNETITLGTGSDVVLKWDGSNMLYTLATADTGIFKLVNGAFQVGTSTTDGVTVSSAMTAAVNVYADDGGVVAGGGDTLSAGRFRLGVAYAGQTEAEFYALQGKVCFSSTTIDHTDAAVCGSWERKAGSISVLGTQYDNAHAGVLGRIGGTSAVTLGSTAVVAGVAAMNNSATAPTVTTGGIMAGMFVGKHVASAKWPYGIFIEPTSATKCIAVGSEAFTTAGSGVPVNGVTLHSGAEFYFDDGGTKLAAGYTEAFRVGYLISTAITTADVSTYSAHDYIYLAANVTTSGGIGATWGSLLVKTGVTITTSSGLCDFSAFNASVDVPSGAVIGTGTWAVGLALGGNLGGTHTGSAAGIRLRVPSAGQWDYGIYMEPTACVKAISVGEEAFTSSGSGVVVNGVTLHSGAEFYFDDGGTKLAAGYTEAFRVGYLVSTAITTADVSLYSAHDYIYLAANVTTSGGVGATWASMLVKTGVTITTSSGLCDFSAFNASVDVPSGATIGTGTFACGMAIGGGLGGTHTGKAVGIRLRVPSAGKWDYGIYHAVASCVCDIKLQAEDAGSLPCCILSGAGTDDATIVADIGADSLWADGSLYVSCVDGAGSLWQKQNDVWVVNSAT